MSVTPDDHGGTGAHLPLVPITDGTMLIQVVSATPLNPALTPSQSQKGWFYAKSPEEIEVQRLYSLYVDAEKRTEACVKLVKMKEDAIITKRNAIDVNNRAIEVTNTQVLEDKTQEAQAVADQATLHRTQTEGTVTKEFGPEHNELMAKIDIEAKRQTQAKTDSSAAASKRSSSILKEYETKQNLLQDELTHAFKAYNASVTDLENAQDKEKAAAREWAETVNQNTLSDVKKALQEAAGILQMVHFKRGDAMRNVFAKTMSTLPTVGGLTAAEFGQQLEASVYIPMASTGSMAKKRQKTACGGAASVDACVDAPASEDTSAASGGGRGRGRGRAR